MTDRSAHTEPAAAPAQAGGREGADLPALRQALGALDAHCGLLVRALRDQGIPRHRAEHAVGRTRAAIRRVLAERATE
jgi:hypothetical protein